jgi:quinol monooxygenase YgiN
MGFIQIIEGRTKKLDEMRALEDEYDASTEGRRTVQRSFVTQDRNDPERFVVIVLFDSYESAMENNELPETQAFSEKSAALVDGPMTFWDLDVIEDRS